MITSGFSEINNPDKIHQFVRGKRLVTFPDLQGRQVGVGTLYSMTDGGLLTSRKLHESDADEGEAFKGRVVICSTQPPSMEDAGNGMTRRMLVLKTKDRQGQAPDNDLDDKLRPELGAIVSWALQADRSDVKAMLSSGDAGGILRESGLAAEVQMDPIRSFIDQCLTPADGGEIANDALLFAAFKLFCHDQQHKCAAQRTFVNRLKAALPHLRMERQTIPGTGVHQEDQGRVLRTEVDARADRQDHRLEQSLRHRFDARRQSIAESGLLRRGPAAGHQAPSAPGSDSRSPAESSTSQFGLSLTSLNRWGLDANVGVLDRQIRVLDANAKSLRSPVLMGRGRSGRPGQANLALWPETKQRVLLLPFLPFYF